MALSPKELEELEAFFSSRTRDPRGTSTRSDWLSNLLPEVVQGVPSTGGGEFTARDFRDLTQYQDTGQFPNRQPAETTPTGLPGAQLQGPGPVDPLLQSLTRPSATPTQIQGPRPVNPTLEKLMDPEQHESYLRQQLQPGQIAPPQQSAPVEPSSAGTYPQEQSEATGLGPNNGKGYFSSGAVDPSEGNNLVSEELRAQARDTPISASGLPGLQSDHYYENVEADRLQGQLARQRGTAELLTGEEIDDEGDGREPGTVSKIFDILMRPNYAMAGGVTAQQEAAEEDPDRGFFESLGDWGRGAKEGLTGERKDTFSDVLENAGVENKYAKGIGGFVLDVALDPTTYVGGGLVKAASKEVAQAAGNQAFARAALDPKVRKQAVEEVRKRFLLDNMDEGLRRLGPKKAPVATSTKQPTRKQIDKLVDDKVTDYATDAMKAAQEAAETAGKVQFKLGGKVVGESTSLYKGFNKLSEPVRNLPTVQNFMQRMSPKTEQGALWQTIKDREGMNVGDVFETLRPFVHITKDINAEQAKAVTHYIEGTKIIDDPKVIEVAEHVQRLFDDLWEAEKFVGLHVDKEKRANYVYHTFNKGKEQVNAWKKKNKLDSPGFTKERTLPTVQDAKEAGMNPVEDIREIVADRVGKHYSEMTHHNIMLDAIDNYGVKVGSGIKGSNWKSSAPKNVQKLADLAEQMDMPLKEFTYRVGGEKGKVTHTALFPEPIVDVLRTMENIKADDKAANTILRHMDKVHQQMKFWLTVANPGHHVRNFYGNVFMAYEDGVRNPKRYKDAFHAVRGMNAQRGSDVHLAAKSKRVAVNNGFSDLEEISDLYMATGTKSGFMDREFSETMASKVGKTVRRISTEREDIARMGHFIDALKKEAKDQGVDWTKMGFAEKRNFAMNASRRVRKYQLDYGDLTQFEKKYARRIMMFYTFARKNTVLQLEMLATRPGKIARVPQAHTAIENVLGVDREKYQDRTWVERMPDWILDMNGFQAGVDGNLPQKIFGRDDQGNVTNDPIFASLLWPTSDLGRIEKPTDIVRTLVSEMRPEIKLPLEAAFGTQAFSGAPTNSGPKTIAQATPITNLISKSIEAGMDPEKQFPLTNWTSWVTGVGVQRATPQRQASELRRRQQPLQEIVREKRGESRDEFLRKIREQRSG